MQLTSLEAFGFRNLQEWRLGFGPGLNILWGNNAQGKTSVLEAVYTLANTKSFRTSQLREAVAFGAEEAIVRGTVARGGITNFSFASTPHSPLEYRGAPPPTFPSEWRPWDLSMEAQGYAYDHFVLRGRAPEQTALGPYLGSQLFVADQQGGFTLVRRR